MFDEKIKAKAIQLRTEDRLSLDEILMKLTPGRTTVAGWIRPHPLTEEEQQQRLVDNGKVKGRGAWNPAESVLCERFGKELSRHNKAKVAEAAVLLRLLLLDYAVYGSPFDGDKADWVVDVGGKLRKIQVKWAWKGRVGAPVVRLKCSHGRRKSRPYHEGEFDFIVGYDLHTDACYVWSWDEVRGMSGVSCSEAAEEKWDKLMEA